MQPHHANSQPNSLTDPTATLVAIQQVLHTISQQNDGLNTAMRDFCETLLQVPAQLQPVAAAALEQVLATRGYSQIIPNATSPTLQFPHFGTMPSSTHQQTLSGTVLSTAQSNIDQYDGDDEDGMLDLDTMVKAKQAARKDKKKTALDNLYDVS